MLFRELILGFICWSLKKRREKKNSKVQLSQTLEKKAPVSSMCSPDPTHLKGRISQVKLGGLNRKPNGHLPFPLKAWHFNRAKYASLCTHSQNSAHFSTSFPIAEIPKKNKYLILQIETKGLNYRCMIEVLFFQGGIAAQNNPLIYIHQYIPL